MSTTRDSLRAATAAMAMAEAADKMIRALEPSARTRVLTLGDHDLIVPNLEGLSRLIANALLWERKAISDRDADLGRIFGDASARVRSAEKAAAGAAQELRREVRRLPEDSPEARASRMRRPCRAVLQALDDARDLANALATARLSAAIHRQVAEQFFQIINDLQGTFSYEATLTDWALEENGMGRKSAGISGPLSAASFDLRNAARAVSVATTVLRDGFPKRRPA